jgi:signal transduction histidine kinase
MTRGIERPDGNDVIRFMFVSLYFIFMFPPMIAIRRIREDESFAHFVSMSIAILLLFFAAELVEFLVLRYRREKQRARLALFLVRIGAVLGYWYAFPRGDIPVRHNPVVSAMIPLVVFYAYFLMKRRWSILILLATTIPVVVEFISREPLNQAPGPDQLGFVVFRTVVIVFFYLLAWFWDTERSRSQENRLLLAELHASQEKLRSYAANLGRTVALEERTRLARDIHDSVGHALTAIGIQLTKALAYFDVDASQSRQAVTAAQSAARDAMGDIRESIGSLNGDEEGIDLAENLSRLAERLREAGISVTVEFSGSAERYNYAVLLGLFRFFQEATTNILKHARASRVEITLDLDTDHGVGQVRDNGVGFDTARIDGEAPRDGRLEQGLGLQGLGLQGLRRRFELIGGSIEVRSTVGGTGSEETTPSGAAPSGTTLVARVPRDPLILIGRNDGTNTRTDR